jgi:hypothetical protein
MPRDRFALNVLDPQDVEAKMPQLRELLDAKRQELEALSAQVAFLARVVGPTDAQTEQPSPAATPVEIVPHPARAVSGAGLTLRTGRVAPAQDRAVQALERAGRPMGPTSLYKFMLAEGGDDLPGDANTLGSNLYAAAKAGRIVKAPNGVYAPLGFPADRPLTDYDFAGENGFPVPSAGHPLGIQPAVQGGDQE